MSYFSHRNERTAFNSWMIILGGLIVVLSITAAGYFFWKYRSITSNTPEVEQARLTEEVGRLMQLPEGAPTIATVTDKTLLEQQGFFQQAENGDKVLLFIEAQRAILYRPSIRKIIDVAPIERTAPQGSDASGVNGTTPTFTSTQTEQQSQASLTIYNGTTVPGLTTKLENVIISEDLPFRIADRKNASVDSYQKTVVVDLSGQKPAEATLLASRLSAEVVPLPPQETPPNSDILIILGQDFAN